MVDGVRVSAHLSFGCLALSHPLRRRCLALVRHPWFDAATLAVILLRHGSGGRMSLIKITPDRSEVFSSSSVCTFPGRMFALRFLVFPEVFLESTVSFRILKLPHC